MAAENMVNKGLSQIRDDPAIASYLDAVSDSKHNEDYDAGSSGSQKKKSGKRKSEGMKDADRKTKSRKTSQPLEDGSKGKRKSEGGECVSRNLSPRTSNPQNPDLDLNQGESQYF